MSKNLHIKPREPFAKGEKWNNASGCLTLAKAGLFTVEIQELEGFLDGVKHPEPDPVERIREEDFNKLSSWDKSSYKANITVYDKQQLFYEHSVQQIRNGVQWCWQVVGKGMAGKTMEHNGSFSYGLPHDFLRQVRFPKLLEGGGLAWLEIFTENNPATGKRPHGIFVNATGTPKIIAAEWRDFTGNLITEDIAFGSTVYLHIYTEALYYQNINIQLVDNGWLNDTDLTPTPSDEDGDPVQKLDPKALTQFKRQVNTHPYNATTKPPAGTITDALIFDKGEEQISAGNVQKCVFPIFIEHAWQFQAKGDFKSGNSLSIKPIVHHSKIENQEKKLNDCVLKISTKGVLKKGELTGNNPLLLGETENGGAPEEQKKIDFTFGVFIDGTLNNMYNTEARQKFEERLGKKTTSQDIVKDKGEEKYRYVDESSYENDLSNPAILFKNYIADETNEKHPIFKIYTEGIGTLTTPNEKGELNVEDYKDDNSVGYIFGTRSVWENTGIKGKVRNAVTEMTKQIIQVMKKNKGKKLSIGTITVDVFGFSRGAAAARNFVHEITSPAYYATMGLKSAYCDEHGYPVSEEYFERKKSLPRNGHLGYLLTQAQQKFDKLEIRFAGIYDTVPHHGIRQGDDIEDLGLNSINKANYVVHLVAADEHRTNFNLAKISSVIKTSPYSGKKGGIELYLPGVHCDVGGSYIEEMPENKNRIDASFNYPELKKLKAELIAQGWFTDKELIIDDGNWREITDANFGTVTTKMALNSKRKYISNQYSFIPLHMMVKFCEIKEVCFKNKLFSEYTFKENKIEGNLNFLNKIKERLDQYAFKGATIYEYEEALKFKQPDIVSSSEQSHQAVQEYHERQIKGQQELNKIAAKKNKDIMHLRNNYLHWNSVYGSVSKPQDLTNVAFQPHAPNKEDGKRKRTEQ